MVCSRLGVSSSKKTSLNNDPKKNVPKCADFCQTGTAPFIPKKEVASLQINITNTEITKIKRNKFLPLLWQFWTERDVLGKVVFPAVSLQEQCFMNYALKNMHNSMHHVPDRDSAWLMHVCPNGHLRCRSSFVKCDSRLPGGAICLPLLQYQAQKCSIRNWERGKEQERKHDRNEEASSFL